MTRPTPDPAVRRRDAAMLRLRRIKQGLTALSLLGAGIVGTAAARAFPGHARHETAVVTHSDTGTAGSGSSRTAPATAHRTIHAHRHAGDARHRRARLDHHVAAARSTSSTQTTPTSPAPPATTPAPATTASAPVTSGGS